MKKIIVVIIFFSIAIISYSQNKFGDTTAITPTPYCFGVRVFTTNWGVGQFYLIKVNAKNEIVNIDVLGKEQFIRQAMGKEQSLANPDKINLFQKYGVNDPNIVSSLWKIRYAKYPYKTSDTTVGWTNNYENPFMPFPSQMKILKQYGFETINSYIYGDKFFKLLKDMEDPGWVRAYTEAGKHTEE